MYSTNAKIRCVPAEKKFAEEVFHIGEESRCYGFLKWSSEWKHDSHLVHKPRRKIRLCAW